MTSTDTQKNTVYYIAKQFKSPCSPEEFAIAVAKHFVDHYPPVTKAKVKVEASPWKRISIQGQPHDHAYTMQGTEIRTAYCEYSKNASKNAAGPEVVLGGVKDLKVLKTTQSGYVGFAHDKFTTLPDVTDRIVATSVTANWKYSKQPTHYDKTFESVRAALLDAFFGPPQGGVYSPSVQYTLHQMATVVMDRVPEVSSVFMNMPNLHFLPINPVTSKFEDDVYTPTSEPHGDISAVVTRGQDVAPHCRL